RVANELVDLNLHADYRDPQRAFGIRILSERTEAAPLYARVTLRVWNHADDERPLRIEREKRRLHLFVLVHSHPEGHLAYTTVQSTKARLRPWTHRGAHHGHHRIALKQSVALGRRHSMGKLLREERPFAHGRRS